MDDSVSWNERSGQRAYHKRFIAAFGELSDTVKQYGDMIFSPQISYGVCTGTGTARSPAVQNSSLKRLPTISADDILYLVIDMMLL